MAINVLWHAMKIIWAGMDDEFCPTYNDFCHCTWLCVHGMEVIVHGIEVHGAEVMEHDVCLLFLSAPLEPVVWIYCNCRYFHAAEFSRIKPHVTFSHGQIFVHLISISLRPYNDSFFHSHHM